MSSTTTTNKKKLFLKTVSIVNLGCSSSCRTPKLSSIFTPKPKPKPSPSPSSKAPKYHKHKNYSSSWGKTVIPSSSNNSPFSPYNVDTTTTTTTTASSSTSSSTVDGFGRARPNNNNNKKKKKKASSVAIEKESSDPYSDFRQSMLQMIVENEIYSRNDLKELLNCFLQLNSPSLHGVIIRVFTEIWNGFFFSTPPNSNNYEYYSCSPSSHGLYVRPKV
ncbi:hypothetical protein vseg_013243 [Gypsophila vaccaria]